MKTIEEGALEHIDKTTGEFLHKDQSFKAGVEFAQRWIPVEEELPDDDTTILVRNDAKILSIATAYYKNRYFHCSMIESDEITHWRPIEYK